MESQAQTMNADRALRAIWDGVNGDKIRSLFADDFRLHNLDGRNDITDLQGLRRRLARLRAAHPRAALRVGKTVGEGSHVVFDWSLREATRLPSSNAGGRDQVDPQQTILDGMCMLCLNGGLVTEMWEFSGALAA